jgi:hypothetical protein
VGDAAALATGEAGAAVGVALAVVAGAAVLAEPADNCFGATVLVARFCQSDEGVEALLMAVMSVSV